MENNPFILQMEKITKQFPGVKALDSVTLEVKRGTIHAICGENGAGKSTLMKVLSGVYPYGTYEGKIIFMGQEMKFKNIKESESAGIGIIHQELTMIPELSVTENIFVGNELTKHGLVDWDEERRRTREILKRVGLSIDPDTLIKHLGVGQQQLVEIAKALSKNVKLLILDEPTSALNEDDSENLLNLMRELKENDITCIMISHKLNEIAEISDSVTVIRDGHTVESYEVEAGRVDEDKIKTAYRDSISIYDGVLTQGNILSRMYISFFWSGTDDNRIAEELLSYLPDDFAGSVLDVPVGTAVFTEKKWRRLSSAKITCLDYSEDMLGKAERRLSGCDHISFVQGDVGSLPFEDASFDIVMSMNGFHAFPKKKKAFKETWRVLKKGGQFIACFYIKGKSKRTDWLVRRILSKKGWFTPPFPTEEQLLRVLHRLYSEVEYQIDGSMVSIRCIK